MAGKTNTTRIEQLEDLTKNLAARLDVYDVQIKGALEVLQKGTETTAGHTAKIIIVEQQLLVLADFKKCMDTVSTIQQDLVGIRKDLESLRSWKDELKKEKDEWKRRWWAFGPNLSAAIVSAIVALALYFLNKLF